MLSSLPLYSCGGGSGSSSTTPSPVPPSILTQPSGQTVEAGKSATFKVLASSTEPITYQWRKNGSNITGATGPTYSSPSLALGEDALYSVLITNTAGTINSNTAQLTVVAPLIPPAITSQPSNQTVFEGEQAIFQVIADGSLPISYQWLRNGQPVSGATSSSYTTPTVILGDDAVFSVSLSNTAGNTTSTGVQLTVTSIPATVDSTTVTVDSVLLTADMT